MIRRYYGQVGRKIFCKNLEEVKQLKDSGEWFRTESLDFYYKCLPYECARGVLPPKDVSLLRMVCVTSVTTKYTYFYQFVEKENVKLYFGKELEDLICKELKLWAMDLNPKTLRGFSGKSFEAYLRAIPKEIYLKEGFVEKMKKALKSGFVKRIKTCDFTSENELQDIENLASVSCKLLEENRISKNATQQKVEENALAAQKSEAINKIEKIFEKK
ncbi:MAG: hypothetical protein J6K39_04280 [Clostridia bacterium]|nr:hypothetical protein [Clostridia bacterium]